MTTLKITTNMNESVLVRCNLANASSPVEIDFDCNGEWSPTRYQCADTKHRRQGLANLGAKLFAEEITLDEDGELGKFDWTEV